MKKRFKELIFIACDTLLINLAIFLAIYIRFDGDLTSNAVLQYLDIYWINIIPISIIKIVIYYVMGLYRSLWRYASIEEVFQIILITGVGNASFVSYMFIMDYSLPRSIYILAFIFDVVLIGGFRFSARVVRSFRNYRLYHMGRGHKRVMIIGAGQAGAMIIKELRIHSDLKARAIAIIDDDRSKIGSRVNSVPVLGDRSSIEKIARKKKIDEIIIAIPSASKAEIRDIVEKCSKTKCKLKILPGIYEIIDGKVSINEIRDVDIEDLLGREPVNVDLKEISAYLCEKVVLVTGGGGSIGSELCRQIINYEPEKLLILDNYENNAFEIENELKKRFDRVEVLISSIRDREAIEDIFRVYQPHVVFHAAAHKHVPLMEKNPKEAVKNNVFGTRNVAECAHIYGSETFVLVSTDKAVNPTNIMGATKRVAEMIVQSLDNISNTEFFAVRFGNVLGSNGSVIPVFKQQIAEGGPVTVTHEDITRYFMTIPEAVQLVIQAGAMAKGGEIFVLDMGVPVKIMDLARNLIRLSGFQPDIDIKIEVTGLRPGEKIFEELLMAEEGLRATKHEKIFIGKALYLDINKLHTELDNLNDLLLMNPEDIMTFMANLVPTYKRSVS